MARYCSLGIDQFDRPQSVIRPHREVITNGDDKQIDAFFPVQSHSLKQAGIAGQVDFLAFSRNQEAGRVTAVAAVGQAGAVVGNGQLDVPELVIEASAQVLLVDVLDALIHDPTANFKIGDDLGPRPLGHCNEILPISRRYI